MSMNWHNFIYGAFDPAGTVSLDKLPGAFWIQALAVRAFGVHTWVIVAPQAAEGVLTVLVLYRAVQRLAGPAAGLIAAFVVAVSPATVALNRGNISDSLMILLLVLAADAVDGSSDNSVYEQVFVYNGFGRFGDQTPLQLLAGQSIGVGSASTAPAAGPDRLLRGDLGRATGWLLPAALVIAAWGIASRRRRPRGDPLRACFLLWGGWLATLVVVFSLTTTINAYYTAALTPAVAALVGAAVATAWSPDRSAAGRRIGLAAVLALTVGYAAWLVAGGTGAPGWLVPAVIAAGLAAIATVIGALAVRNDTMFAAAIAAALVAGSLAPAVASAELAARHEGAFDTPFEPAREQAAIDTLFVQALAQVELTIPRLEGAQNGAPYLLATQTAALASVFIYDSGLEALPIGGFTGTIPAPTLRQLQDDIRTGRFHLVLAAASTDPRLRWIAAHCMNLGNATATLHNYYCLPQDAGRP
jgi:4-amino-4-deoxy-L-arabinose transferase-like glycosyltransferase